MGRIFIGDDDWIPGGMGSGGELTPEEVERFDLQGRSALLNDRRIAFVEHDMRRLVEMDKERS